VLKRSIAIAVLGGLIALPACTSNQAAVEPPITVANVGAQSQLQFQVGTANLNGTTGLNTVVTFRQPNGLSALLDDTPVITLPYTNTGATGASIDAGKNTISGVPQPANGVAVPSSTFGTAIGAFAYGLLSVNSSTTGANSSAFYPAANTMPYYVPAAGATVARRAFYVGPGNPFVTSLPLTDTNYVGAPSGFTTFYAPTPTTGSYSLSVGLAGAAPAIPTFTATTTLSSTAVLGLISKPVYTSTGAAGGGTVTFTVPAGVTETAVFINDRTAGTWFTLFTKGTGAQSLTLAAGSIPSGDVVRIIAIGFDYPAMEAVPFGSAPPQAPVINNSGSACSFSGTTSTCPGQADLTESAETNTTQ
jgi:hypothetical protein